MSRYGLSTTERLGTSLAAAIELHLEVMELLWLLREQGSMGLEIADQAIRLSPLASIRIAWKLWAAAMETDEQSPDMFLRRHLGDDHFEMITAVLWPDDFASDSTTLRLVT